MVQEGRYRKVYPSDLTDEQWAIVEAMIPPAKLSLELGPVDGIAPIMIVNPQGFV